MTVQYAPGRDADSERNRERTTSGNSDYVSASGTLTIAAGQTTGTIPVTVIGDIAIESDETFTMTLSNPTNATLSDATATGTITENETSIWSGQAYVDANWTSRRQA